MEPPLKPVPSNTAGAVKNSIFGLLSLCVRLAGNMIIFVVIARLPGIEPSDFGMMTYGSALAALFVMVAQFGLVPLLIRDIAAKPERMGDYVRSAFALRLLFSIVGLVLIFIYVNTIDLSDQARWVCYIMAFALFFGSFSSDLQALFQCREKMHLELFGVLVESGILLASALLAFLFHPGIVQIAYIFLIAKLISLVLNYGICARFLLWVYPRFNPKLWWRLLKESFPFALATILAAGVLQLDTVLMRQLAPGDAGTAVGLYQAAVRLFVIPMFLPEIVLKVFLPQFSRVHGRKGTGLVKDLGRVNHILLTLGVLIGLVTLFRGKDIIEMFYGQKYAGAGPLLQVMGVTIMLRFGAAYNLYFTIRNRIWFRVGVALATLFAFVGFDFILIPKFGAMGAAYAAVLAYLIHWAIYLTGFFLAERNIALGWNLPKAVGVGLLMAGLLYVTAGAHVIYMGPVYVMVIAGLIFVTLPYSDRGLLLSQVNIRRKKVP